MGCNFIKRLLPVLLLLLALTGCLSPVAGLYSEKKEQRPNKVYVVKLGWHVGIAFKGIHLREKLPGHDRLPETGFLLVGWGDNRYYPAERVGVGLFMRAAFLPTGSVIHVVGFDQEVESYFVDSDVVRVQLSERGVEQMSAYLAQQFRRSEDGSLEYAADGLYGNSAFFKAKGLYFFPRTSNWWAARLLRKSGYPITPVYAITSGNVIRQAGKEGEVIR